MTSKQMLLQEMAKANTLREFYLAQMALENLNRLVEEDSQIQLAVSPEHRRQPSSTPQLFAQPGTQQIPRQPAPGVYEGMPPAYAGYQKYPPQPQAQPQGLQRNEPLLPGEMDERLPWESE